MYLLEMGNRLCTSLYNKNIEKLVEIDKPQFDFADLSLYWHCFIFCL